MSQIKYFDGEYTNWAQDLENDNLCNIFASATYKTHTFRAFLNPTDARGYRSIVALVGKQSLNRDYTSDERIGLGLFMQCVTEAYLKITPVAQNAMAGNNAQYVDEYGNVCIGNKSEPGFLHGHIWGRGDPSKCYVMDVPLKGPSLGQIFDMAAKGNVNGNVSKEPWESNQMQKVCDELSFAVSCLVQNYKIEHFQIE